jgi:hypothetical protein
VHYESPDGITYEGPYDSPDDEGSYESTDGVTDEGSYESPDGETPRCRHRD